MVTDASSVVLNDKTLVSISKKRNKSYCEEFCLRGCCAWWLPLWKPEIIQILFPSFCNILFASNWKLYRHSTVRTKLHSCPWCGVKSKVMALHVHLHPFFNHFRNSTLFKNAGCSWQTKFRGTQFCTLVWRRFFHHNLHRKPYRSNMASVHWDLLFDILSYWCFSVQQFHSNFYETRHLHL